jgi:hypothetical protein
MSYWSRGLSIVKKLKDFFFPPKPELAMPSYAKLNIFQKGVLQTIFSVSISVIFLFIGVIVLLNPDKIGVFPQTMRIFIFCVAIAVLSTLLALIVMQLSIKLNIVFSVIIENVIEFSHALEKLRIFEFDKQIDFISKRKIPLFVAKESIYPFYKNNIRVKMFLNLNNKEKLKLYNGDYRLCLNVEDYECIIEEDKERFSLAESVALMEKEDEIRSFKEVVASLTNDKNRLKTELAQVQEEAAKLRRTVKMQPTHAGRRVERLRVERLQWAALIPAMEKLMREAPRGKKYTTWELEAAFAEAWAHRSDLREQMRKLTESEETTPSKAIMSAVAADFADAGLFSTGGRPRKKP